MNVNIVDWFDSENIEHLKAYAKLMETGVWPKNFLPSDIYFPPAWSAGIDAKLAQTYIKKCLRGDGCVNVMVKSGYIESLEQIFCKEE